MSADNQLVIIQRKKKFLAYDVSASCEVDYNKLYKEETPNFTADTLEGALALANKYVKENIVEYGYMFVGY